MDKQIKKITDKQIKTWVRWVNTKYSINIVDAEDVVQQAIMLSLEKYNRTEDKETFNLMGYIFAAVYGQAMKHKQLKKRYDARFTEIPEYVDKDGQIMDFYETIEDNSNSIQYDIVNAQDELLNTILILLLNNKVKNFDVELFKYFLHTKLTYKEIAERTGVSDVYIKNSLYNTKEIIKDKLTIKQIKEIEEKYGIDRIY
jgi:RNA polymerase sigma factor (sigma-70 family)